MAIMTEAREAHKLDLAAEVLSAGGTIRLQALGTSMLPSIWPGDVLSIERPPGQEIVPGDIVLVARDAPVLCPSSDREAQLELDHTRRLASPE